MCLPGARASASPALTWDAPAGCPDGQQVEQQLHLLLAGRSASDRLREVHARVEPRDGAWLLVVDFVGPDGTSQRRLTLQTCEATANAAALLIAIAFGLGDVPAPDVGAVVPDPAPDAPDAIVSPPSAPDATEPSAPEPRPPPIPSPQPQPIDDSSADIDLDPPPAPGAPEPASAPATPRPRGFVQAGPALALGVVPRPAAGLVLAGGAAWPRLRLSLGYAGWFPSSARLAARPEIGARVALHAAAVRVGPVRAFGPLELHGALALEVGAITAEGVGSDVTHRRVAWWGAALVGGGLAFAPRALRGRAAALLQVDAVVPLHRPAFVFDTDVEIFRLGALGLRTALQLEVRFPWSRTSP